MSGVGGGDGRWRVPLVWRLLLWAARWGVPLLCRLRVSGEVPRGGPVLLASNHIGLFDPVTLTAACARLGLAPRIMATGGLFSAPVVGAVFRRCGHIRVNRGRGDAAGAVDAGAAALARGCVVAGYPEGRITLDPGMWPERGKTGLARLALVTGVPVVAVAQWGAHEMVAYHGLAAGMWSLLRAVVRRPVVRVHFGARVDLDGLSARRRGDAVRASERIMRAIRAELVPLRGDEPGLPRFVDMTRPVSCARTLPGEVAA